MPRSSSRYNAGYSDPCPTLSTSPDCCWIRREIAQPCSGPACSVVRTSRSSVPCWSSGAAMVHYLDSRQQQCRTACCRPSRYWARSLGRRVCTPSQRLEGGNGPVGTMFGPYAGTDVASPRPCRRIGEQRAQVFANRFTRVLRREENARDAEARGTDRVVPLVVRVWHDEHGPAGSHRRVHCPCPTLVHDHRCPREQLGVRGPVRDGDGCGVACD